MTFFCCPSSWVCSGIPHLQTSVVFFPNEGVEEGDTQLPHKQSCWDAPSSVDTFFIWFLVKWGHSDFVATIGRDPCASFLEEGSLSSWKA